MSKLVECVPNFSEGCNTQVIEAIASSIRNTSGCNLLNFEPGESTNRTVYTFVGNPSAVVEGAINAAHVAYKLIDMVKHKGEHPRFGALDVCPFIPVRGVTMEDCIQCAEKCADRLAKELLIPVYLYGFSATTDRRKVLSNIRAGEYENLPTKIQEPAWKPDYGPTTFVPHWGATAVGARNVLIAYNINLISTKEQAHKIALNIRESGRGPSQRGRLKCVQAIGWGLEEHNLAQVSVNITDCQATKIHQVYEEVCKDAQDLNLPVVGSEIIGLVPLQEILDAANFYVKRDNLFVLDEKSKVQLVTHKLGLSQLNHFDAEKRIIEYMIPKDASLTSLPLSEFITSVASRKPTPGGGSVSAAVAAMGAALCTMAGQMTYGRKKWEEFETMTRQNIPTTYKSMMENLPLIDGDANAFDSYIKALKLPAINEEEAKRKDEAKQEGMLEAIKVPMQVISNANTAWDSIRELAAIVNMQCLSDIQVGAKCLETGVWGAYQNVLINLPKINDENLREKLRTEAEAAVRLAEDKCAEVLNILKERIK
ncbi:formimidoyltransferase-cyclodeaminase-like [Clavelina lepadiformis]|uniref:Formimidoyltransferase-cyclodeaminase n=1 Tax=Clavelina lepadiformis TaxID=159417 RepID=A0ABP0EZ25_CLALP